MRRVSIIGIGAGDPEYVTVQAIRAMNEADAFFVVTKGAEQQELVDLRMEILERYVERRSYRIVEIADAERRRGTTPADHRAAVGDWRHERADRFERAIRDELAADECGAFLVWGDPSLYDSTLGVLDEVLARGTVAFDQRVVPGISSVQSLAAGHRIALNRVGGAVEVTTGRRLAQGLPDDTGDVVVMLDPGCTFTTLDEDGLDIYWGAYLGTDDEILVSGPVAEVGEEIVRIRAEAKQRKGWMFDTYLLRRTAAP